MPLHKGTLKERSAVTWRAFLLGSAGVCLVCGLTPYNDYILENTMVVGSYLPLGVVLTLLFLALVVNVPLRRWRPGSALRAGELAVIVTMMLVGCSIPGQGLMRSWLPSMVWPFHMGALDAKFWEQFLGMKLPAWLWPVEDVANGRASGVVLDFYGRSEDGSVPWGKWIGPLLAWSVPVAGIWMALMGLAAIVRHQWADNERLAFPLAKVQAALLEDPESGRLVNRLFAARSFWVALAGVFVIQSLSALHVYFPTQAPEVRLRYDLTGVLREPPIAYLSTWVKAATIYFTFVGITFFIQSRISFSLVSFYLIEEIVSVEHQVLASRELPLGAWGDQTLGATVALIAGLLWVGRAHWWRVLRAMVGHRRAHEREGTYIGYGLAGWMLVGGSGLLGGWLVLVGVKVWFAAAIVLFLLMVHIAIARIVAQTGLPFIRMQTTLNQIYTEGTPQVLSTTDLFWGGVFTINGPITTRESLLPFALHGLQVHEEASERIDDGPTRRREGRKLVLAMVWALVLGFVVSIVALLKCYYTYAGPLTPGVQWAENRGGLDIWPQEWVVGNVVQHAEGRFGARPYDSWLHKIIGVVVMGGLQWGSLRWAAWPLAPIGYLVASTWYIRVAWFSILIGWLAKVLIMRFGGGRAFEGAKPFFIGLICGESLAAGTWMMVALVRAWAGLPYERINMLPF